MRRSEVSAPWADVPIRPRESQNPVRVKRLVGVDDDALRGHTSVMYTRHPAPLHEVARLLAPIRERSEPRMSVATFRAVFTGGLLQAVLQLGRSVVEGFSNRLVLF